MDRIQELWQSLPTPTQNPLCPIHLLNVSINVFALWLCFQSHLNFFFFVQRKKHSLSVWYVFSLFLFKILCYFVFLPGILKQSLISSVVILQPSHLLCSPHCWSETGSDFVQIEVSTYLILEMYRQDELCVGSTTALRNCYDSKQHKIVLMLSEL